MFSIQTHDEIVVVRFDQSSVNWILDLRKYLVKVFASLFFVQRDCDKVGTFSSVF